MSIYAVAQIQIEDRAEYEKYIAGFAEIFSKYDGELLSVDDDIEVVEGSWPFSRTVICRFPDKGAFYRWYHSEEYQTLAKHRFKASTGNLILSHSLESA